jgi:hypothetical protein
MHAVVVAVIAAAFVSAGASAQRSMNASAAHDGRVTKSGSPMANPFGVHFHDVTKAAGIHFRHERAASD